MNLALLLLAPLTWIVVRAGDRRQTKRLRDLVGSRLSVLTPQRAPARRARRILFFCCGIFFLALATLWPERERADTRLRWRGADLVACLDVSRSMLAADVRPDRLRHAQREILALLGEASGDRIALVVFAGDAHLHIPLTRDGLSYATLLAGVGPSDVGRGGTDLGAALDAARAALPGDEDRYAAVLLLTDGEDLAQRGLAATEPFVKRGIPVHCIGLGSARGSKITLQGERGSQFLRDPKGSDVLSALDEAGLRRIAEATGGRFLRASGPEPVAAALYAQSILPVVRGTQRGAEVGARVTSGGPSLRWPLLIALGFFLLASALGERRRR